MLAHSPPILLACVLVPPLSLWRLCSIMAFASVPFEAELWLINGSLVATIPMELRKMNPAIREKTKYRLWIEVSS